MEDIGRVSFMDELLIIFRFLRDFYVEYLVMGGILIILLYNFDFMLPMNRNSV